MSKLPNIFAQNKAWADSVVKANPTFFSNLSTLQAPEYLWIGCSDSRVPANQITGLLPGQVFVHRNVGNLVLSTDLNCLTVIQYAVDVLQVKHIIVCGHYGCGAIQAAWENRKFGLIDYWLNNIRNIRDRNRKDLATYASTAEKLDRLCELSVLAQARSVCQTAIVQDAWAQGKELSVHGWIYRLDDGRLNDLGFFASGSEEATIT